MAASGPRVALDAMGGDHAPDELVAGALDAHRQGVDVVVVGRPAQIAAAGGGELPVVAAESAVDMAEEPALAVRRSPDSSVRVAARLLASGEADTLVSAGSTGATVAAALLELGRVPGVRRPAIAAPLPTKGRGHHVVLLDAGASVDVQPAALLTYACMGVALAQAQGIDRPRVGLLNVGAEPGKGNEVARQAFALLSGQEWFVGNVEPPAVRAGSVDVVVTDGFTGNVFLKAVEAWRPTPAASPGAAVLLGVPAPVFVAHGAARRDEVAAAVRTAAEVTASGLTERMAERLAPRRAEV